MSKGRGNGIWKDSDWSTKEKQDWMKDHKERQEKQEKYYSDNRSNGMTKNEAKEKATERVFRESVAKDLSKK